MKLPFFLVLFSAFSFPLFAKPFEAATSGSHRYIIDADPSLIEEYAKLLPFGFMMGSLVLNSPDEKEIHEIVTKQQPKLAGDDLKKAEENMKAALAELQRREKHFSKLMGNIESSQKESAAKNIQDLLQVQTMVQESFAHALWNAQTILALSRSNDGSSASGRKECLISARNALSRFLFRFEAYSSLESKDNSRVAASFKLPDSQPDQLKDLLPYAREFADFSQGRFTCAGYFNNEASEILGSLKFDLYGNDHDQLVFLDQLSALPDQEVQTYIEFTRWAFQSESNRLARFFWQKANQLTAYSNSALELSKEWAKDLESIHPELKNEITSFGERHWK